jgi:hypothetical protein
MVTKCGFSGALGEKNSRIFPQPEANNSAAKAKAYSERSVRDGWAGVRMQKVLIQNRAKRTCVHSIWNTHDEYPIEGAEQQLLCGKLAA